MDVLFKIEPIETFTQVLEDVLDSLYDLNHISSNKIVDLSHIKAAKEEIKNIILDTNLNANKVSEVLSSKNYKNDDSVRTFISLIEKKKTELLNSTIVHYNCEFGETLDNFQWKLKLVCGTSDLKTLFYPLLQLSFCTVNTNHTPRQRIHEVNKDILLKLIGALEEFVGDNVLN